ncbi:MAG: signal peptidase I [Clostridiales bacterium]|nr:signal peptidase I [Clostridiales bacterium]
MKNNSEQTAKISEVIKDRRTKLALRKGYISLLWRIILLAIAGYLLLNYVFIITQVSGNDMFPAVKDGDLIIGFRLQQTYLKNDVVVYRMNGERFIGRVAARGSDVVAMNDSGTFLVNGTTQGGEILYPTYPKEGLEYPYQVPGGHIFILGDYRTQARDSRDFGAVPLKDIEGKVITIIRRRGL